jgi:RND family efflux transporter MFP subunit
MDMKAIIFPSLARASVLLLAVLASSLAQAEVPTVRVGAAAIESAVRAEASIEAVNQGTLAAQVPGRVVELNVDAGDRVRQGQVLLRIDPAETAAMLAAADAGVVQAETALANARVEFDRARSLVERKFLSASALDAARTQFQSAEAQVRAARAARVQAAAVQGHTTITAPLTGMVAERHIEAGETAQPGMPLLTLYDPEHMRAVADLAPQRLAQLGKGPLRARVELDGGRQIEATSVSVLPAADARTHTVRVRIDLPPGTEGLAPGSFARVHFLAAPVADVGTVRIPRAAVLRRGELTAVYVADEQGGFGLRQIRLGSVASDGEHVEVLSGLKGDEVLALDPVKAGIQRNASAAAAR